MHNTWVDVFTDFYQVVLHRSVKQEHGGGLDIRNATFFLSYGLPAATRLAVCLRDMPDMTDVGVLKTSMYVAGPCEKRLESREYLSKRRGVPSAFAIQAALGGCHISFLCHCCLSSEAAPPHPTGLIYVDTGRPSIKLQCF